MAAAGDAFETARRHVAANVARLRRRRSWTQQKAADMAGLDLKHVQKVEYASLNPSLRTLVRLAAAFGVPVQRLLAPTSSAPPKRPVGRPKAGARK